MSLTQPSAPAPHLQELAPVIGHWRSSGTVIATDGRVEDRIAGTDIYRWAPGGNWIVHEVDVVIGDQHQQAVELIGGRDASSGGWQMHAFDDGESPGVMTLTAAGSGVLLLQGDGVRSWLRPQVGPDQMAASWEREIDGTWVPWMDMHFDRMR